MFGLNKSGTTFLQSLLNSHPAIACPGEHHFGSIWKVLHQGIEAYRRVIEDFDQKTARQGVTLSNDLTAHLAYRGWLESLFQSACVGSETHVGLNDNSLDARLDFHADLFPDSKFVFILRDPRDVSVSLFYHRKRTEPGFDVSLSEIAESISRKWVEILENVSDFSKEYPGRIEIVRYEDLISNDKQFNLQRILKFLELPTSDHTIEQMFADNDIGKMKKRESSRQNESYGFYRSGKKGGWREELSMRDVARIELTAGKLMRKLQYQTAVSFEQNVSV